MALGGYRSLSRFFFAISHLTYLLCLQWEKLTWKPSIGIQSVFYPGMWQGTVEASSVSGQVDVHWEGLKILEDQKGGGVNERIKGLRIAEGGYLGIVGDSGSVTVQGAPFGGS